MTDKSRIEILVLKKLNNDCSDEEFQELKDILRSDPEAVEFYVELVSLCAGMLKSDVTNSGQPHLYGLAQDKLADVLSMLANNEQAAESIEIMKPEGDLECCFDICQEPEVVPFSKKISKLHTVVSFVAACLLMTISFFIMFPPKQPEQVATITGNVAAVWNDGNNYNKGKRLYATSRLKLEEGFAQITFDNNAEIVVQSPAELRIENENQMFLYNGKITAIVPESARGFVVRTVGASIVDYGTEFGVTTDRYGTTETDVFVGNVELRSGSDPIRFKGRKQLVGGQAGNVYRGTISDSIREADSSKYSRVMPKSKMFGIPGKRIDVADLFGKGNGYGTGVKCVSIDPASGDIQNTVRYNPRESDDYRYHLIKEIECIDGVFIPYGEAPVQISSEGHVFKECPVTAGIYWMDITNYAITSTFSMYETTNNEKFITNNGIEYGNPEHPAISLHANAGITLDLDAIRRLNPGVSLKSFETVCGISETLRSTVMWEGQEATMWVLVDGKVMEKIDISSANPKAKFVSVDLNYSNRFLTLISTEGENDINGDWVFFGEPALIIESNNSGEAN